MAEVKILGFGRLNRTVLSPCDKEETPNSRVALDFRRALLGTRIFVYGNDSSDNTSEQVARASASVVPSCRVSNGNVRRPMFVDIDADVCIMADEGNSYEIVAAQTLIRASRKTNG